MTGGGDLVQRGEDTFGVPGLRTGPTGVIEWPTYMSYEQWDDVGMVVCEGRDWTAWVGGDWLLFGETRWQKDDKYLQAKALTGRSYGGLRNLRWVAKKFPLHRRRETLTWSHHRAVAGIKDDAVQDEWLDHAEAGGWSVDLLDSALRDAGLVSPRDDTGAAEVVAAARELHRQHGDTLDAERVARFVTEGIERERRESEVIEPPPQLQMGGSSLAEICREIVSAERDEHDRVCLGSNLLERLRAALGEETA